jgi:hypothetical protein
MLVPLPLPPPQALREREAREAVVGVSDGKLASVGAVTSQEDGVVVVVVLVVVVEVVEG